MDSPADAQIGSTAPRTPFDRSAIASDSLLLEWELALASSCGERPATERAADRSTAPTISYEEALVRELEYRRRVRTMQSRPPVGSGCPRMGVKETHQEQTPLAMKRKPVSEGSTQPSPLEVIDQQPSKQSRDMQASRQKLQFQQPSPPPPLQNQQPKHLSPFWCKLCKVDCVTEFNFKSHIGGKKHAAKKLEILRSKNTSSSWNNGTGSECSKSNRNGFVLCKECNVPCRNEMYFAAHCAGKRHTERLLALQALREGANSEQIEKDPSGSTHDRG